MILFNPLEQFQSNVFIQISYLFSNQLLDVSFTNYSFTVLLLIMFFIICINIFGYFYQINFLIQNVIISFVSMANSMIKDHMGNIGKPLLPLLVAYLVIIFFSNVLGMIPYGLTLTAQLVITFYLAFTLFLSLNIAGILKHKQNLLSLFFPSGTPLVIAPLIVPVEIISYVFRVISLSVRLFANMMAGHTLVKVIAGFGWAMFNNSGILIICGLIPLLVITILIGLELAVAGIQAYVFITLASMYFHDAFLLH
jgi:F-type H+-transporting ATPase subunit a